MQRDWPIPLTGVPWRFVKSNIVLAFIMWLWPGGIAIEDELGCWSNWFSVYEQTLTVAGGTTSPKYDIWLYPRDEDMGKIWKNSK